ncbi:MAG: general secretion pathway protein GspL [Alcanivorax borkumensis]|uniref:Type II secretion system protein L n=1 Tax=Alcanivorax borkumensis (strain ATCC 700651 / DSM 11573 / NCIMB 13689 / SK2) TaxID=393595 RepID=Q0VPY1_ALCBS|nr:MULTISPECIES: type II secretion system protein GspL [Alcanivorax]OJH07745.1 MAG: general secretion pathway protein GspL [Alcanivorax borkumensis]EUC71244.1 general secretion pathway protein L [Alcanivorax sp. 97CO-5]PKG02675.1 general secretion pathway protein GspL [Alcanivorax sp. 97CO-6]CAL16767.1 General secretion pathway protein L [Alcanivorax borkumensis SK2]BAP14242.1 general secretion pathway protein L [Alcanivorax sp. NBRC 101098]
MAEAPLIYLSGAGGTELDLEHPVLLQRNPAEHVQVMSLREALEQSAGQTLHVIVSVAFARLTHVSLSRKQARHMQRILPYLLEEQMLDNPESLWFVSRKGSGDDYEVTAIARQFIEQLKRWAAEQDVLITSLQVDAERLQGQAPLIAELDENQTLLMADRDRCLVVDAQQRDGVQALFGDSLNEPMVLSGPTAFVDALRNGSGQELLTGPYAPKQKKGSNTTFAPWKPLGILAASVFVLALVAIWVQQWRYNQAAEATFADAQTLFENLFPGDKASAALSRQFEGRLARLGGGSKSGQADFFPLLRPVAQVLKEINVDPKRLQYDQRENTLLLDVGAKDYAQLEQLQNALKKQGARASIANYRNSAQGVSARIKVEQPG